MSANRERAESWLLSVGNSESWIDASSEFAKRRLTELLDEYSVGGVRAGFEKDKVLDTVCRPITATSPVPSSYSTNASTVRSYDAEIATATLEHCRKLLGQIAKRLKKKGDGFVVENMISPKLAEGIQMFAGGAPCFPAGFFDDYENSFFEESNEDDCSECNGIGWVDLSVMSPRGMCTSCQGTGEAGNPKCELEGDDCCGGMPAPCFPKPALKKVSGAVSREYHLQMVQKLQTEIDTLTAAAEKMVPLEDYQEMQLNFVEADGAARELRAEMESSMDKSASEDVFLLKEDESHFYWMSGDGQGENHWSYRQNDAFRFVLREGAEAAKKAIGGVHLVRLIRSRKESFQENELRALRAAVMGDHFESDVMNSALSRIESLLSEDD